MQVRATWCRTPLINKSFNLSYSGYDLAVNSPCSQSWNKKVLWLAAAVLFSTAFHGLGLTGFAPWHVVYTDVMGFFDQLKVPGFPYISKQIEYPVLTGVFMQLMFYIGVGKAGYYFVSALFLGALVLISTYLLWDMLPPERRSRFWVYWVFAPSMLMFLVFNWDIIAIFFTIMAIYVHKIIRFGPASQWRWVLPVNFSVLLSSHF